MLAENKFIQLSDNTEIHVSIKEVGAPVWLIATHGVGEHLERHQYLMDMFGHDFNVLLYDIRGHGRSGGRKAHIHNFSQFYQDLEEIVHFLQNDYSMKKYVLFGHSMGGLITAGFMQKMKESTLYPERVFFSAPAVAVPGLLGNVIRFSPMQFTNALKDIPWTLKLGGLVDLKGLSHDPHVVKDYIADELNHLQLHSKLLLEMVHETKNVFSRPLRIKCPSFCAIGSGDQIVDQKAVVEYFSLVEKGTQLKIIKGAYHEMHNEIDKYQIPYFEFLKNSIMEALYFS